MSGRNVFATLLLCTLAAVAAIFAVRQLSAWLIDEAGNEGRIAIALANAPWFASAPSEPVQSGPRPSIARRAAPSEARR